MGDEQKELRVGFVGNPNCGKTTLFNAFTGANLKVANWPGVTVERVEGETSYEGKTIRLIDLPGIYSLTSYTIEEKVTSRFLASNEVDVMINVVDASSLERNLYLTLQLLDLGKPVILALNMMDIVEAQGMVIDLERLSAMLGHIPVVPVSARKRAGLNVLMHTVVDERGTDSRKIALEDSRKNPPGTDKLASHNERAIIKQSYDYIDTVLKVCLKKNEHSTTATDRMDQWLAHPVWGVPIFLGIMAVVFFLTFTVGDFLKIYVQILMDLCAREVHIFLTGIHASTWMVSLVVDGIIAGVGGVLTFLPNIGILFLALAFLEDSGYMARVAYVMNEIMGKAGVSGKAFLPMLLGFGCTVPAVLATRALPSGRDRRRTIWITPFMSCSARLPIYVLFANLFFPNQVLLAVYSLYLIGMAAAIVTAFVIHKLERSKTGEALLIELPEYRLPNQRTVVIYVWDKVKDYLFKAGTTIFVASVFLWFVLGCGPYGFTDEVSHSFAAILGQMLVPVLRPAGLGNWQIAVALISGLSAKEVVVSSFSVLFSVGNINSPAGMSNLHGQLAETGFGGANAYALMIFCLFYTPCVAAMGTIKRETGSWKYTVGLAVFQLVAAWCAAVLVYQLGSHVFH